MREIEIGKSRKVALENLGERVGIDEISILVKSILQAEELGVSIVKVLRVQSLELRDKRKDRAEEKAMKAPIKILFPLLFFIFPVQHVSFSSPSNNPWQYLAINEASTIPSCALCDLPDLRKSVSGYII